MPCLIRPYRSFDKADTIECIRGLTNYLITINLSRKKRVAQGFYESYVAQMEQDIEKGTGAVFLAEVEGQVVGCVYGRLKPQSALEHKEFLSEKTGQMMDLFVREGHQKIGVGTALVAQMERFFKQEKCQRMSLLVLQRNSHAVQYYAKMGFEPDTIEMIKEI